MKRIVTLLLSLVLLFSCASADESSWLYVEPVEGLADDFIMGMDASSVLALEEAGVRYYDFDGTERDLFLFRLLALLYVLVGDESCTLSGCESKLVAVVFVLGKF